VPPRLVGVQRIRVGLYRQWDKQLLTCQPAPPSCRRGGLASQMGNAMEMRTFQESKQRTEAAIQMIYQVGLLLGLMPDGRWWAGLVLGPPPDDAPGVCRPIRPPTSPPPRCLQQAQKIMPNMPHVDMKQGGSEGPSHRPGSGGILAAPPSPRACPVPLPTACLLPACLPCVLPAPLRPLTPSATLSAVGKLKGMMGAVVFQNALMDMAVRRSAQESLQAVEVFSRSVIQAVG